MPVRYASLYLALFVSGASALVYQSTWGRMLQRVFGVSDLAVATVLAAFFLGLGLGSGLGGRWAGRVRRPARVYAILEAAIGAWAFLSLLLIPRLHSVYAALGEGASFGSLTAVRLVLALVILLPPTILMGATLPVLVAVVARAGADWSRQATYLYATNTIGAMVGAGATGLYLVPTIGTRASVIVAALGSLAAAAIVAGVWRKADLSRAAEPMPPPESPPTLELSAQPEPPRAAVRVAMLLAGIAGFASLASEVLWTRVLRMIVQGTTQAFAAMLVNYLAGIAIGSLLANALVKRGRSAARWLGISQIVLAVLTAGAMWLAPQLPRLLALLHRQADLSPHDTWVMLAVSALLLLPIAIVLGTSIPLAWRIAGGGSDEAAEHTGGVLAANTFGGLLGSMLAGFVLVPALGIDLSILIVILIHLVTAAIALRHGAERALAPRAIALAAPAAVAAAVMILSPSVELPFLLGARHDPIEAVIGGPSEKWRRDLVFLREGRNTTVTVTKQQGLLRLFNDGRPESGFSATEPGFGPELGVLAGIPSLVSDERDRAMIIGLGAGHTATIAIAADFEHVEIVELEEVVVEAARLLHEARGKPFPLDAPSAHLVVDDARTRLVLAPEDSYDIVISQPSHPWLAGSSALYTREFFEDARRALRPAGAIGLWVNLFRIDVAHVRSVVATLRTAFPHVHAFNVESSSFVLVASERPIAFDAQFAERLGSVGQLASFLGPHRLDDLPSLLAARELDAEGAARFAEGAPILEDDRPALEFDLARLPETAGISLSALDRAFAGVPWISPESFGAIPADQRLDVLLARVERVSHRRVALQRVESALDALSLRPADAQLVRGAIAEAYGDVRRALAAFDAASVPAAATRADRLRHAEHMHRQLLREADRRAVLPSDTRWILSAAIALGDPEAARLAVEIARRAAPDAHGDHLAVAGALASGGCDAVLRAREAIARAIHDPHVAFLAERCSHVAGDLASARRYGELRDRARRAAAAGEAQAGVSAEQGGNGGAALRHYRRALTHNPGHALAGSGLARLLHRIGRRSDAERVLRDTLEAAAGLPAATQTLWTTASQLGIPLGERRPDGAPASPTAIGPSSTDASGAAGSGPEP